MRRVVRVAAVVAAAVALSACSGTPSPKLPGGKGSGEYFSSSVYGKASPRVAYGRIPKGGGRKMVGAPYRVAGKTYIPRDNPNYSAVGLASWYGAAFHGRKTANGEVYDVNGLTGAHPTLPLPSYVRVTNLENGRSIVVRVNDRGPFHDNRVIDLSARAADMLGYMKNGTAQVQVEYVGPARMDGRDEKELLASYRDPNSGRTGRDSMFAWVSPKKPAPAPVAVAMAPPPPSPAPMVKVPMPVRAPVAAAAFVAPDADEMPIDLTPASLGDDDPLADVIMRTSVRSYAAEPTTTPAQRAVEDMANGDASDLQSALVRAAAAKASELRGTIAPGVTIRLGTFGDAGNAARIAASFARYGSVETRMQTANGRDLTVVSVNVGAGVAPAIVLDAAKSAGLTGAALVSN